MNRDEVKKFSALDFKTFDIPLKYPERVRGERGRRRCRGRTRSIGEWEGKERGDTKWADGGWDDGRQG